MSKGRELADYLADILTAIIEVDQFIAGMTIDQFEEDRKTINAVIRSLEVLGEATKHIPTSYRNKHPEIPWSKMAGMRDVLIHDYMGVDLMTVWKVAKQRLPEIKLLVEDLVAEKRIK
ncbi:Uncharacterized conserved protein, contains HEPN domain [Trichlorobacter thiogenes]|uniref:Uncharacterized conserved protein, contains HEPN domain n=1 Tax=Trichlorobacter thiogenes TaxID=115783 RepID=A0A1T4P2C6_9BACT|nr:DUF86 domain-containing protein [Trichlorobacter thiogenes]SJZ85487.1 Uncharacterized conserved protein, contains HEPN domain [Trichlorobacter thiogenes]